MIGCLGTRVCKQPINALYFESEPSRPGFYIRTVKSHIRLGGLLLIKNHMCRVATENVLLELAAQRNIAHVLCLLASNKIEYFVTIYETGFSEVIPFSSAKHFHFLSQYLLNHFVQK